MRRLLIAIVVLVVLAVGGVALYRYANKDSTTKVSVKDAGGKPGTSSKQDPGLRPDPGTYAYVGGGTETVDLLGGAKHDFPRTTPTVIRLGAGCHWSQKIILVKESQTTERMCTDTTGVRELGYDNSLTFLGITQVDTYACSESEDAYRLRQPIKQGDTWSWTCTAADSDYKRTATVIGTEDVTVGGKPVSTTHVRIVGHLTRKKSGASTYDYWQLPTGLVVRYKAVRDYVSPTALGKTKYHQSLDYRITSLQPR
jgi:hypothetical protein